MDAEDKDLLIDPKPVYHAASSSLLRTLISLLLFIAVDYWIFKSWSAVMLLVSVIFLHESGHFIAMKIFGYKGINMTFVPFMGAYVSGEATHFSKYKKIIVLLAGPLPGIAIGMGLLWLYQQNQHEYYYLAAAAFLLLNVFNLLPVSPLDGGQFIETLFFSNNLVIQRFFLIVSMAVILYLMYALKSWFLVVIAWFILQRIRSLQLTSKVRKELDRKHVSYDCSYDDLTDEHYAMIRDVLIASSTLLRKRFSPGEYSIREGELIPHVERILVPAYYYNLTRNQQAFFILLYFLAFVLPLVQWGSVKGWF